MTGWTRFDVVVSADRGRVAVVDRQELATVCEWLRPEPCPAGWPTETWCVAIEVVWLENLFVAPCAERAV